MLVKWTLRTVSDWESSACPGWVDLAQDFIQTVVACLQRTEATAPSQLSSLFQGLEEIKTLHSMGLRFNLDMADFVQDDKVRRHYLSDQGGFA